MANKFQSHVTRDEVRGLRSRLLDGGYTQRLLGCYVGIDATNLNKRLKGYLPTTVKVYNRLCGALDDFDRFCREGVDLQVLVLEEGRRYGKG